MAETQGEPRNRETEIGKWSQLIPLLPSPPPSSLSHTVSARTEESHLQEGEQSQHTLPKNSSAGVGAAGWNPNTRSSGYNSWDPASQQDGIRAPSIIY